MLRFIFSIVFIFQISLFAQDQNAPAVAPAATQENNNNANDEPSAKEKVSLLVIDQLITQNTGESMKKAVFFANQMMDSTPGAAAQQELALKMAGLASSTNYRRIVDRSDFQKDYEFIRASAATVLGRIPNDFSRSSLALMAMEEPSTVVASEALISLSKMPIGENGEEMITGIFRALQRNRATKNDPNLSMASISALENVAAQDMSLLASDDMIYELTYIIDPANGYIYDIRKRVLTLLESLLV